jgi:tRNA pseudouridine65 synthase
MKNGLVTILYNDDHIVAVCKPSGLLTHPTSDAEDRQTCMSLVRDLVGQRVYPLHRLDRGTSGVLLFGRTQEAARYVQGAFARQEVQKQYVALVRGWMDGERTFSRPLRKVSGGTEGKQEAVTHVRTLGHARLPYPVGKYPEARYSLVRAVPVTGRKHQIRRHLAHNDHPVIGDAAHGDGKHNRLFRSLFECHHVLLHSARIRFRHPVSGREMTIHSPVRGEMVRICEALDLTGALQRAVDPE